MQELIDLALAEDVGAGDLTAAAVVPAGARARARIVQKAEGVVAGLDVAEAVFRRLELALRWRAHAADGDEGDAGRLVAEIAGPAAPLLAGERVALNFLGRLSGVATLTARYVEAVAGTGAAILDTRKTTPGLRALEKRAVAAGGGRNHRAGLYDALLVKENHAALAGGIAAAARAAVAAADRTGLEVVVECASLDEVDEALAAGAPRVLLDNLPLAELREAVARARGRAQTEASGGITLDTVRAIAETGVDYVSVGALTHSAPALDLSMSLDPL
ncbi:MAG TPA: carboxylating nicotinate-nucleotide diphosphorylase [Thermoleophilaceae bacterium]|nr:carboxylating nicotinate-nucleotide diphosphorylase [Thermoleophilaceae bacterium]